MKKINVLMSLTTLIACCCLSSCKKSGSSDNSVPGSLSYEYSGVTYHGSDGSWGLFFNGTDVTGITITRYDLFGGEVIFNAPDCAWLDPHTQEITLSGDCVLTYTDGNPIDSSAVYLYQSGVFNVHASNCRQIQKHDPYTGEDYYVDECDVQGNFNLTLVNNQGDIIEIKNGTVGGHFEFQ